MYIIFSKLEIARFGKDFKGYVMMPRMHAQKMPKKHFLNMTCVRFFFEIQGVLGFERTSKDISGAQRLVGAVETLFGT
jgi:hypothetical protein